MTKHEGRRPRDGSPFGLRHSDFFRHSSLVIRPSSSRPQKFPLAGFVSGVSTYVGCRLIAHDDPPPTEVEVSNCSVSGDGLLTPTGGWPSNRIARSTGLPLSVIG